MRKLRVLLGIGLCLAGAGVVDVVPRAEAARNRRLKVLAVNVANRVDIELNAPIEVRFNGKVLKKSLPGVVVLGFDPVLRTFSVPVAGRYSRRGRTVIFTPRIPTHERSPADPEGDFFPAGSIPDQALGNPLFPGQEYQVRVYGKPHELRVKARGRRPMKESFTTTFTTRERGTKPLYRLEEFGSAPPPTTIFANPADSVPGVRTGYVDDGVTQGVATTVRLQVFGNGIPLDPFTTRLDGNVRLTVIERDGDPTVPFDVAGTPFLEQSELQTMLQFEPRWPLPDRSVLALRISSDVLDVSTQFGYAPNPARQRLRDLYEWLAAAARVSPGIPPEQLPDPPADWITDWPIDRASRGVLKTNLLAIDPDSPQLDPQVHLLFGTRDEPVSSALLTFDFEKTDGRFNAALSTADWDEERAPGAVAARLVNVGGDGSDGDFLPTADTTLSLDGFASRTAQFRTFRIPEGVTVRVTGSRPGRLLATTFDIGGHLVFDGQPGDDAETTAASTTGVHAQNRGGAAGPGGGAGGDATLAFSTGANVVTGDSGEGATGEDGLPAPAAIAGTAGGGGFTGTTPGATRLFGGAGGGGGGRTAGGTGNVSAAAGGDAANGTGGAGGAAAVASDASELAGGTGGGAGGNAVDLAAGVGIVAAGGGGGGGAAELRGLDLFAVRATGSISARGGDGGNGSGDVSGLAAGPGGGGSGGALLLRGATAIDVTDTAAGVVVSGGAGGTQTGAGAAAGGDGGAGRLRVETPQGGVALPGGTAGTYAPLDVAGASRAYSTWTSLGVATPRLLDPQLSDVSGFVPAGSAVLVEIQLAVTDSSQPAVAARPDVGSIQSDQSSDDADRASAWIPVWVQDGSAVAGGAFGALPGFDADASDDAHAFPISAPANDRGYTWVRVRVRFHVGPGQTLDDPVPYVDRVRVPFQFN